MRCVTATLYEDGRLVVNGFGKIIKIQLMFNMQKISSLSKMIIIYGEKILVRNSDRRRYFKLDKKTIIHFMTKPIEKNQKIIYYI